MRRSTALAAVLFAALTLALEARAATGAVPRALSFVPALGSPIPVGKLPYGAAVSDFDGDRRLDVAVASNDGVVSVLLGDGTGRFAPAPGSPIKTDRALVALADGDFNGDARPDLVLSSYHDGTLLVLFGDGAGRFTPAASPAATDVYAQSVAVRDVDGDGRQDLLADGARAGGSLVLLGSGTGEFTPAPGSPVPAGFLAPGDFNADGRVDLTGTAGQNAVAVLLGLGGGRFVFGPGPRAVSRNSPVSAAVTDLDVDGRQDLAVVNAHGVQDVGGNGVTVLLGDGRGRLAPAPDSPVGIGGTGSRRVAAGDFNADGQQDLAVTHDGGPGDNRQVSLLLGDGAGGFVSTPAVPAAPAGAALHGLAVADFNGDARPDLVVTRWNTNDIAVLLNTRGDPVAPRLRLRRRCARGARLEAIVSGDQIRSVRFALGDRRSKLAVEPDGIGGTYRWVVRPPRVRGHAHTVRATVRFATRGSSVVLTRRLRRCGQAGNEAPRTNGNQPRYAVAG